MKKSSIQLLCLTILLLSACTKWYQPTPNMPEEIKKGHEEVLQENLDALKESPKDSQILFQIAYEYEQLGYFKKAEEYYLQTIESDNKNYVAYNNLANIYEKIGKTDKAAEAIKKCFELSPDRLEGLRDVVRMLLANNEPDSAEEALDYFTSSQSDASPEVLEELSDMHQQIVDYRQKNAQ